MLNSVLQLIKYSFTKSMIERDIRIEFIIQFLWNTDMTIKFILNLVF